MVNGREEKDVRYLNKDYSGLKQSLVEFAKVYYPDTYNDFSESSLGMMFIDMASYVGDVLSYYTDVQFKESLIQYAEERENVVDLASALGYRIRPARAATADLDVFIVVPAMTLARETSIYGTLYQSGDVVPDLRYAPVVNPNMVVSSDSSPDIKFRTLDEIDFSFHSMLDPVEVRIYETDETGVPVSFLLRKTTRIVAGTIKTDSFVIGDPTQYRKIQLSESNVLDIIEVEDDDGNFWREVPYLAQDTVYRQYKNTHLLDPKYSDYSDTVKYMLDLERVPKRFIVRTNADDRTSLQFGSGASGLSDDVLVPNPKNIGNPLYSAIDQLELPIDPSNFLATSSYGEVPHDTTLYVTYTYGGGIESNVPNNDIINVDSVEFNLGENNGLDSTLIRSVKDSIGVINPVPATGGDSGETTDEIRQNAMAYFTAQNRVVTREDYIVRSLSMPAKYGSVAKVYVTQDEIGNRLTEFQDNPLAVNLYVLGYNRNKRLAPVNLAVKQNLKTYLSQYRILTDAVNIKDGFIVNLGVYFEIIVYNNYNKREVLLKAINAAREFFSVENMGFNQPIIIGDFVLKINQIAGVQNVAKVEFENLYKREDGYSGNRYQLYDPNVSTRDVLVKDAQNTGSGAIRDGILYPSLDPSVFEVRFPDKDIKARAL